MHYYENSFVLNGWIEYSMGNTVSIFYKLNAFFPKCLRLRTFNKEI